MKHDRMVIMEILDGGRSPLWLRILLVICIACVSSVNSQQAMLSIDCGSDEYYTDPTTGIVWSPDAEYISTGENVAVSVQSANSIVNPQQAETARYFSDTSSRHCYVLPVISGQTYLIRPTFYFGNLTSTSSFEVYVDQFNWLNLQWDENKDNSDSIYAELIYSANASTVNVCLAPIEGPSFISALELRQLASFDSSQYSAVVGPELGGWALLLKARVNCGAPQGPVQFWRYPDDPYDRIWSSSGENYSTISNPNIPGGPPNSVTPDRPPRVVMENAWYDSTSINLTFVDLNPGTDQGWLYVAAYFQELDGNATSTNVRGMKYYLNPDLNERLVWSFNLTDKPLEISYSLQTTNLTISVEKADWSGLGPVLNAFEVYAATPFL